ncbi:MAG: hypothetical protein ACTSRS_16515 [Candidatus Helarchaeota archaeon]
MVSKGCESRIRIWGPDRLSPRIKRLRDEYFDIDGRELKNEVAGFTTGTDWDQVWSVLKFAVAPEIYMFGNCFENSILATAKKVELPNDFWDFPLVMRKAIFFDRVMSKEIAVNIISIEEVYCTMPPKAGDRIV